MTTLMKKWWLAGLVILFFAPVIFSDSTMGLPAAENILLIYNTGTTYKAEVVANITSALTATGAVITNLPIPQNDLSTNTGIYSYLTAAALNLDSFCEVWDLRYDERHNALKATYSLGNWDDTITCCGGTTDNQLFQDFLEKGGHLYLQGEHDEFSGRNMGLLQLIQDVSGAISWPGLVTSYLSWTAFDNTAALEHFGTDYNLLVSLNTYYPGVISAAGNGHMMTTNGGQSLDLAFLPQDMKSGSGKMFVNFDTNSFTNDAVNCPAPQCFRMANEGAYIQNVYDFLADCYKYTLTKSVSPSMVSVGDMATYTICYNNIGAKALSSVTLWDTIPAALSVISTTPSYTSKVGNYITWSIGPVSPGANACITVQVQAISVP